MTSARGLRSVMLMASCSVILSGCASSTPTRFFTVAPVASTGSTSGAAYRGAPIKVAAVQVPPSMDRLELVRQSAANELVVDDFANWAAPLGELARGALTQDLATRLPARSVIYPDVPEPDGTRRLTVDILAFTYATGTAQLDVSWTLAPPVRPHEQPAATATGRKESNGKDATADSAIREVSSIPGEKLASPRTLRLSVPVPEPGPREEAASLSSLLGQLADSIAEDLARGPGG